MAITPEQLRTEVNSGPIASQLTPLVTARNWQGVADKLNDRTLGGGTIEELEVNARQLLGCVVGTEYLLWSNQQRDLWRDILSEASRNSIPIKSPTVRQLILAAVPVTSTGTRTNLGALQTRAASRIEMVTTNPGEIVSASFIQAVLS